MTKQRQNNESDGFKISEDEVQDLYSWIDGIKLSRPKRNIARDFSDGVLVAEIVNSCIPNIVDMHNYTDANAATKKRQNWALLNRRVFKKLNYKVQDKEIEDLIISKPFAIERVLMQIRRKIDSVFWARKAEAERHFENDKPEVDQLVSSQRGNRGRLKKGQTPSSISPGNDSERELLFLRHFYQLNYKFKPDFYDTDQKSKLNRNYEENVSRLMYEEKCQECLAKDETIKILEAKIKRLEHLIHLKDVRIEHLQSRIEANRPTGVRN